MPAWPAWVPGRRSLAAELCPAGVWERAGGGYRILDRDAAGRCQDLAPRLSGEAARARARIRARLMPQMARAMVVTAPCAACGAPATRIELVAPGQLPARDAIAITGPERAAMPALAARMNLDGDLVLRALAACAPATPAAATLGATVTRTEPAPTAQPGRDLRRGDHRTGRGGERPAEPARTVPRAARRGTVSRTASRRFPLLAVPPGTLR